MNKPSNFAQQHIAAQNKWKQTMIKQLNKTTEERVKREEFLKTKQIKGEQKGK